MSPVIAQRMLTLLGGLAKPIAAAAAVEPKNQHLDSAVTKVAPTPVNAPQEFCLAVATSQIVSLKTEPAMRRDGERWLCLAETRVELLLSSGQRSEYRFAEGTEVAVQGHLVLLPRSLDDA